MVFSQLKAEMRAFCKTTSVRGVSRIVNSVSHSKCHLVTRRLNVRLYSNMAAYSPLQDIQIIPCTVLLQSQKEDDVTFPDVTVCNLNHPPNNPFKNLDGLYDVINSTVFSDDFNKFMIEHYPTEIKEYSVNDLVSNIVYAEPNSGTLFLNSMVRRNFTFNYTDSPIISCKFVN